MKKKFQWQPEPKFVVSETTPVFHYLDAAVSLDEILKMVQDEGLTNVRLCVDECGPAIELQAKAKKSEETLANEARVRADAMAAYQRWRVEFADEIKEYLRKKEEKQKKLKAQREARRLRDAESRKKKKLEEIERMEKKISRLKSTLKGGK